MILPLGQLMMATAAGPKRMGRVMGIAAIPAMLGPILGPTLGGLILEVGPGRRRGGIAKAEPPVGHACEKAFQVLGLLGRQILALKALCDTIAHGVNSIQGGQSGDWRSRVQYTSRA